MEHGDGGKKAVEGKAGEKIETEITHDELVDKVLEVCGGEKPEVYGSRTMTREEAEVVVETGFAKLVIEEQEKAYAVDHKRYWHQWVEDDRGKAEAHWKGVRCPWSVKIARDSSCVYDLIGRGLGVNYAVYNEKWKVLKDKRNVYSQDLTYKFLVKYGFSQDDVMAQLEVVDTDYKYVSKLERANIEKRIEVKKQIDELLPQVEQIKKSAKTRKTRHTTDETQEIIRLNGQILQLQAKEKALREEIYGPNPDTDINKARAKIHAGMLEVLRIIDSKKDSKK